MSFFDSCLIIERMKQAISVREDKELALSLNVQAGTLSKWKTRNSLPIETLLEFAEHYQISVEWLIYGRSSQQLDTAQQMALLAFNALDEKKKLEAIAFMSGLKNAQPNSGINLTANGSGNNQQIFHGEVSEVTGIKK